MDAHFFDLDVLVDIDNMVWIVNKTNPSVPIIKISKSEFNLIKKGIYRKYKQSINIGDKLYWLSDDIMNNLKIRCKNLKCDISDISFSMREFIDTSIIENLDIRIIHEHFQHLKNTNDDIYIICSKNTEKNYKNVLNKLSDKMSEFGLTIKNFYYLSETFYNRDSDEIAHKKTKLLLQHLFGFKTENDKFINDKITKYDRVNFYDDDLNVISMVENSNKLFDFLISNTDSDVKLLIKDIINLNDNVIILNKITHNMINPFIRKNILIEWNNIKKTFEGFIFKL